MPSSNPRYLNWKRRESVRNYVLSTQDYCGICGLPVDKTLGKIPQEGGGYKWHPMSPVVDEIVPIARGGSPYDRDNVQLAHRICNAKKGAKAFLKPEDTPFYTPGDTMRGADANAPQMGVHDYVVTPSRDW